MRAIFRTADSVTLDEARSPPARACSAVPQDSVLILLLLIAFINDLTRVIKSPWYLFADDAEIVCNPRESLVTTDLDTVCAWSSRWGVPLNIEKRKHLATQGQNRKTPQPCSPPGDPYGKRNEGSGIDHPKLHVVSPMCSSGW